MGKKKCKVLEDYGILEIDIVECAVTDFVTIGRIIRLIGRS